MVNLNYIGYVIAIFSTNAMLGVGLILKHMRIWYAFTDGPTLNS
jgi:hypothetical protein